MDIATMSVFVVKRRACSRSLGAPMNLAKSIEQVASVVPHSRDRRVGDDNSPKLDVESLRSRRHLRTTSAIGNPQSPMPQRRIKYRTSALNAIGREVRHCSPKSSVDDLKWPDIRISIDDSQRPCRRSFHQHSTRTFDDT